MNSVLGAGLAVLGAPVWLAQGWWVRRRVPRLPEPAGARHGVAGQGPALRVLIFGDSAAAGVGVDVQTQALSGQLVQRLQAHRRVHWQLVAHTGDTSADALRRLALVQGPYDAVLVSLGVNDVTSGVRPRQWRQRLGRLREGLRAVCGAPLIWFTALPPMHGFTALPSPLRQVLGAQARRLDAHLADWCGTQTDCRHLPVSLPLDPRWLASDGFHPGAAAYARWAEVAALALLEAAPPLAGTFNRPD